MRFAARSTSSAPVTTRRRSRSSSQRAASAGSRQAAGTSAKQFEMDAAARRVAVPREPGLLGGEAQDRREPARQAVEGAVHHGPRRAPRRVVGRVAIEPVLADVEIERRQIDRAEIMQRGEHRVEIVIARSHCAHDAVELGEAVQHPALELRHLRRGHGSRPA